MDSAIVTLIVSAIDYQTIFVGIGVISVAIAIVFVAHRGAVLLLAFIRGDSDVVRSEQLKDLDFDFSESQAKSVAAPYQSPTSSFFDDEPEDYEEYLERRFNVDTHRE